MYFSTNRIGPPELCAVLLTHRLYLFTYPDSLIHFDRSASFSTRVLSRRCCREDWASLLSDHSRRVALSARYALNTWRVRQVLARRLRRHSHCNPSPADQYRNEPNRIAWVVRGSTDAPVLPLRLSWQPNPFRSLRVALDASCRVAVLVRTERRFCGSLSSRRVVCEIRIKYMTCQAGIGQTP